jgi:tRNA U34 5-carboxymethylaminomethyl modifying enzyme MnmG/GidA
MNPKEIKDIKVLAATQAIAQLGGLTRTAEKIAAMTGKNVNRHHVNYWTIAGIQAKYCPAVHQLTKIPLSQLDPEIYPVYLFAS